MNEYILDINLRLKKQTLLVMAIIKLLYQPGPIFKIFLILHTMAPIRHLTFNIN